MMTIIARIQRDFLGINHSSNCAVQYADLKYEKARKRNHDRFGGLWDSLEWKYNGYNGCGEDNDDDTDGTDTCTHSSLTSSGSTSSDIDTGNNTPDYGKIAKIFEIKMDLKAIEEHQHFQQ